MRVGRRAGAVIAIAFVLLLFGCAKNDNLIKNGYYSAEAAEYDQHGWKEFVTIYVSDNHIVTAEYNAKNKSGLIKSWDPDYMRIMNGVCGTYPNEYARAYVVSFLESQEPERVDAVTGATHSYHAFKLLAQAAVEQAKAGDMHIAFIDIPVSDD